MRLKNLAVGLLFLPNVPAAVPATPPPVAAVTARSVLARPVPRPVCIGEMHGTPQHFQIERETVQALAQRGYKNFDMELSRDIEGPARDYFRSARTPEDYRALLTTFVDRAAAGAPPRSAGERETIIGNVLQDQGIRQAVALSAAAHDAGMAVHFIDVPARDMYRAGQDPIASVAARNEAMGRLGAEHARESGTILINGFWHETTLASPNSLPGVLIQAGSAPCQVFQLAVDGQRPELSAEGGGSFLLQPQPVDGLAQSAKDIVTAVDKERLAEALAFQRTTLTPIALAAVSGPQVRAGR